MGLFLTWTSFQKIPSVANFNRRQWSRITKPAKSAFVKFSDCSTSCFHFPKLKYSYKELGMWDCPRGIQCGYIHEFCRRAISLLWKKGKHFFLSDLNAVTILLYWSVSTPGFSQGKILWCACISLVYLTLQLLEPIEKQQMVWWYLRP